MSHGVGADSDTRGGAKLLQRVPTGFATGQKAVMAFAFSGAEKDKLVEIIENARFAQNRAGEYAAWRAADGQTIGSAEDVIGGFPPAAAIHKFDQNGGLSGNMLFQIR